MTTLISPCTRCSTKGIGIFKCQGCSNVFCRKHATEHRDVLSYQLDEIFCQYDQIQEIINQTSDYLPIFEQLKQWEEDSIKKIQHHAKNVRQDIHLYLKTQKENTSETLRYLANRLRKAREDDDYIESDLQLWTSKIDNLKKELTDFDSSIHISEDQRTTLISNIYVPLIKQNISLYETLSRSVGDVHIEDNGQLAIHSNRKRGDTHLFGRNEYINGKHKIRFIINKTSSNYITTFGVASAQMPLSVCGWSSDDQLVGDSYSKVQNKFNENDLKDATVLQIELLIDCDNKSISYTNERTGYRKEINIDIALCPFPWQLYFYLYDINDRVRILSLNKI